jgi:hypothetical protein
MVKKRLNADDAFKSIMGKNDLNNVGEEKEKKSNAKSETITEETQKEKLIPITLYITEKQRRAMKIKTALGNKPEDKDLSSIVRAALDIYLSDTLMDL